MTNPPLNYATPDPLHTSRKLIRLLGIFLLVAAGLELLSAAVQIFMVIMQMHFSATMAASGPALPFYIPFMMVLFYAIPGLLDLIVVPFLVLAGVRLLRKRNRARFWGFVASILCICSVWNMLGYCCLLVPINLAIGVFGLVILSFADVKSVLEAPVTPGSN